MECNHSMVKLADKWTSLWILWIIWRWAWLCNCERCWTHGSL